MPKILKHVVEVVGFNGFYLLHCYLCIINIIWHKFNQHALNFWPVQLYFFNYTIVCSQKRKFVSFWEKLKVVFYYNFGWKGQQKLTSSSLIYILSYIRMKQLLEFFNQQASESQVCKKAPIFVVKQGSFTYECSITKDLKVRFQDQQRPHVLVFKQDCYLFPSFSQKKVSSIAIYYGSNCFHITGQQQSLQTLYLKLSRLLSHKGFNQFYKPIKRVGRGTFATVYLVEHKYTGIRRAAKVFSKEGQKIQYKGKQALENQIKTLKEIDHPNLIKFDGLYETESLVYLVTEYLSGGTLEDTLKNKAILTGELIQSVIRDILSGLAYLDENQIMHRDIKPQNVILREQENRWIISDFGLAAKSNEDYLYDKCGTMGYIAPEIMELEQNKKYAQACDTYSLGIIAYQLIVGELPFKVESINLFDKKIIWLMFDREECRDINPDVLNFLRRLLDNNPSTRITPKQALQSPFFKDQKVVGELIAFHERRRQARYDRILKMANLN